MKVFIYYLNLPDNLESRFPKNMISDFLNVKSTLNMLDKRYNDKTESWYYLYAFTNDKEYVRSFEYMHDMSLFTKIVKKMSEKEYEAYKHQNIDSCITKLYYGDTDDEYILGPKILEYDITDTLQMLTDQLLIDNVSYDYNCFNKKYIEALDKIGYCTYYSMREDDDGTTSWNLSYGYSAEGFVTGRFKVDSDIPTMYCKVFSLLLKKSDKVAI